MTIGYTTASSQLCIALTTAILVLHAASSAQAQRRVSEKRTVAHICLEREIQATGKSPGAARPGMSLLDTIIRDVASRLPARINSADPTQARHCFETIDSVLAEHRFYVAIPTNSLMETLASSPSPSAGKILTKKRRNAIARSAGRACHRMDCDTGSLIYLAVAEALRLPIVIVEAPGHKFVRWQLTGRQHINWDTNAAREYSNNSFRRGKTLTYKTTITPAEESAGKFLTPLTRDDFLAYHRNIIAGILEKRGAHSSAADEYRKALKKRPHDSLAANNLAWLYLDYPPLRTPANVRSALQLSIQATSILPRNRDYRDTLARAYAANGQFDKAIAAEKLGYNNRNHISRFQRRQAY